MGTSKDIIIKPNPGFQERFVSSNADIVFGGGAASGGKSYAIVLTMAEALMTDPDFRGLISRRSLQSQKAGGGFVDTFQSIFGDYVNIKQSDSPRATFESGAYCDMTYIDDSAIDKMRERAKGWQYDVIAIDELTEMSWEVFTYLQTRNRGQSKTMTGKFYATFNPKRSHWTRTFLDWYIGVDGRVRRDRDGKVRYFYVAGSSVKDVVWGDTKEEVYAKCRIDIDSKLNTLGGSFSYKDLIKSFVFYQGLVSENKVLTDRNPGYIGSLAASGGQMSKALLEGNFNVDPDEETNIPIPSEAARLCFENNPATNGDKWITVDLADYGTDNLVALAWNGFHVTDILILSKSAPRDNALQVMQFARKNAIAESNVIFDATSGRYFNDYLPEAMPFISAARPIGLYFPTAAMLKDLCYLRLCQMIKRGQLTFEESVANATYRHQNMKYSISVQNEFMEECSVVRFDKLQSGRMKLWNKKRMNMMLGHGRSMDLLDPCAMRMLPCTNLEYGEELQAGFDLLAKEQHDGSAVNPVTDSNSIYNETIWY